VRKKELRSRGEQGLGYSKNNAPVKDAGTTKFKSQGLASCSPVSETFQAALSRVDLGKYIDEIQEELRRAIADIGPGKTPGEVEAIQARIQELIRRQSTDLAKEVGLHGNLAMGFLLSNSIISTAWVAFSLRREASDLSKSPEDRLAVLEMLDSLSNALAEVVQEGDNHADRYAGPTAGGGASGESSK